MILSGARRAGMPVCAALLAIVLALPFESLGQAAGTSYAVRAGDTLFSIARKTRHDGVTLNQMLLAVFRANPDAFAGGNINRLIVGRVLSIPGRDAALAVAPAEAARQVQGLIAAKAVPPPAPAPALKEPPPKAPPAPAKPAAKAPLGPDEMVRRYREGLSLERRGDDRGALNAYLEAAESGHGLAQKKLGEIYDKGNSAVERDYETALRWYQRAREQGIEIPKPFVRSPR